MEVIQGRGTDERRAAERVAIIREYAATSLPSAAQTRLAASKLGLSTARLHQLVRAWHAHGQTSMATGSRSQQAEIAEAAIAAAEGDLDMSKVPEHHRTEVERRIRLLGRYLRNGARDRATTKAFTDEFGGAYNTFRNALNIWLLSCDPAKMPGAAVVAPGRRKGPVLDQRVEAAVRRAVTELGRAAGLNAVHRRVAEICRAEGLKRPSAPVVYKRIMAMRAEPAGRVRDDAVCLDRVSVTGAGSDETSADLTLTLLFGSASGRILAHRVDDAPPSPTLDADVIAALVRRGGHGEPVTLETSVPAEPRWDRLMEALVESGVGTWYPDARSLASGRLAFTTFGNTIAGMRIRRLKPRASDGRLDAEALSKIRSRVAEAVDVHNENRSDDVGPLVDAANASSLLRRLDATSSDQT